MFTSLRGFLSAGGLLVLGCLALAQGPGPGQPAKRGPARPGMEEPDQPRDPTVPSPNLKKALDPPRALPGGAAAAAPRIPAVLLKGRVLVKDKPAVALIELEGKVQYLVGKGTIISTGGTQLHILDVNATEIRIDVQPLNEIILLR